jgi:chromate reductase
MESLNVVALSGSLRKESYNRKALKIAKEIAEKNGAIVREVDLKLLNLPMFDEDFEFPTPNVVKQLTDEFRWADVVMIASPEYNHSVSGALKNAIDWISRNKETLKGKWAIIFGVSSGNFGTIRAQAHLRHILDTLDVYIIPKPEVLIGPAKDKFDDRGNLIDAQALKFLEEAIIKTLKFSQATKNLNFK